MNRREIVSSAVKVAGRLRTRAQISIESSLCPYDLADKVGAVVRFAALPSLEGMYAAEGSGRIVISSERPAGRRRYTCAHELGHREFGHGTRCDELGEDNPNDPDELLAQCFAAALLMPKLCIESAFARRGWKLADATPAQVFTIAQSLGVGYTTLLGHMERTLRLVGFGRAAALARVKLPNLRAELAGTPVPNDLFVVDRHWGARPIDVEVGDMILVAAGAHVDAPIATPAATARAGATLLVAASQGTANLSLPDGGRGLSLRIARRNFVGLAKYRHLEEVDGD